MIKKKTETNRKGFSMRQKEALTGIFFILPWLIGLCWFFLLNIFQTGAYSFSQIEILPEGGFTRSFIGFENYRFALFENVNFNRELTESLIAMLIDVPMIIFFSLFMALLLNRKFAFRGTVRVIFFLPIIMATAAINNSLDQVMTMMMGGISSVPPELAQAETGFNVGIIVRPLIQFGMPPQLIGYIVDTISHIYVVIRSSSVQIIIFLAALQAIPSALYEVAQIEGASAYESFWKITFPMVSPLILTNVVYTIVDRYTQSNIVEIAHQTAFIGQNFGLASAMSIISTALVCLLLFIAGFGINKYVYYQN